VRKALAEVQTALKLLESTQVPGTSDIRFELAKTEDYLGRLHLEQGDSTSARAHFDISTRLLQQLLAASPDDPGLLRELSVVREQAGGAANFEGDLRAALDYHEQALKLRERLSAGAPLNADYQRTIAVSWYNIGEVLAAQGKLSRALDAYRRNGAISEKLLAADPSNQEYRGDLAYARLRVGDMLEALGRHTEAKGAYRRSLDLRTADVRADPTNLWKRSSLIEAYAKLSRSLRTNDRAQSFKEAGVARALMEATTLDSQNAAILSFFAGTYADLGDTYRFLGTDPQQASRSPTNSAEAMYERAEEIWHGMDSRGMLSSSDRKRRAEVLARRPEKAWGN
jgi:tetratricopeptide (TPR) repeat protein